MSVFSEYSTLGIVYWVFWEDREYPMSNFHYPMPIQRSTLLRVLAFFAIISHLLDSIEVQVSTGFFSRWYGYYSYI